MLMETSSTPVAEEGMRKNQRRGEEPEGGWCSAEGVQLRAGGGGTRRDQDGTKPREGRLGASSQIAT